MKTEKIIIVDDEPIVRAGLENWLSPKYKVISFDSASTFLDAFNKPDFQDGIPACILLDFQMPGMNGIELQERLAMMNTQFPIIFMSGNAQQADIIAAWRGGAVNFLLKPFTPTLVSEVIEKSFLQVKKGNSLDPETDFESGIKLPITKREAEVLLLLGKGYQQSDVSKALGISIRTVKMYRTFLKDKLGLNTLAELGQFYTKYRTSIEKLAAPDLSV